MEVFMVNKYNVEFKKLLDFSLKKVELKRVSQMNSVSIATILTGLDNSVMNAKLMKKPMMKQKQI